MKVKTRFSPSPTGVFHIGGARTALYSWLFSKRYNGKFLLRIEDTDINRSKIIYNDSILKGLKWLNLNWDEGPYFQSSRLVRYNHIIQSMLKNNTAYKCYCSTNRLLKLRKKQILLGKKPKYDEKCRNISEGYYHSDRLYAVRFRNPKIGKVVFLDQVRGKIEFLNNELDDLVIQRSNGLPTYNFSVVIDDYDMKITHVIRGEEHINNTVRQINILNSLGKKIPIYAHLSTILNNNGKKISKRDKDRTFNVLEYKKLGFFPEAMINYLLRLGWSHGNQEIFTIEEMKKLFSLKKITKSSSLFDKKKLLWINRCYMNILPKSKIINKLRNFYLEKKIGINNGPNIKDVFELMKIRCSTLLDMVESSRFFYEDKLVIDHLEVKRNITAKDICILKFILNKINFIEDWKIEKLSQLLKSCLLELEISFSEVGKIIRLSLTGKKHTPSIKDILYLFGKEKCLFRIKNFIKIFKIK
ncbi:Glutamate--tRNA ligase [Buchnera aphidicola (Tetraneura ulmi)]|uniref:glutamate--tRNA ligase n=1 Tax=Buchnera aphidicola TaxID=9 RepID=UPI003463F73C